MIWLGVVAVLIIYHDWIKLAIHYGFNPQELLFLIFDKGTNAYTYSRLCYNQIWSKKPTIADNCDNKPDVTILHKLKRSDSIEIQYTLTYRYCDYDYRLVLSGGLPGGKPDSRESTDNFMEVDDKTLIDYINNNIIPDTEPKFTEPEWEVIIIKPEISVSEPIKKHNLLNILYEYAGPNGDFYKSVFGEKSFSISWLSDYPGLESIEIYDTLGSIVHRLE